MKKRSSSYQDQPEAIWSHHEKVIVYRIWEQFYEGTWNMPLVLLLQSLVCNSAGSSFQTFFEIFLHLHVIINFAG